MKYYSSILQRILFFGSSRHVTHLAYTWTCVCNEPEIKVRQHSREDIKVIYDPGRCYENLPFYFFFYFLFSKNPRLCTLDPRHVTLDPRLCTLDPRPSTKTQTRVATSKDKICDHLIQVCYLKFNRSVSL